MKKDVPGYFPKDWRERLDLHAQMGHFNADEHEVLNAAILDGERWGITRERAEDLLRRGKAVSSARRESPTLDPGLEVNPQALPVDERFRRRGR